MKQPINNFKRITQSKSEYEITDLITGWVCNNEHKLKNKDGTFNSLPFLWWLQSTENIFGEPR